MPEFKHVYVVIQSAIYRHDICGVFSTREQAEARAKYCLEQEQDHYHDYEVYEIPFDVKVDSIVWDDGDYHCYTAHGKSSK